MVNHMCNLRMVEAEGEKLHLKNKTQNNTRREKPRFILGKFQSLHLSYFTGSIKHNGTR